MEIVKCHFAVFVTVTLFQCTETLAYDASRIRAKFQNLDDDIYYIKKDITTLIKKTDQLNISVVESCGPCISGSRTSRPPVPNYDGRQDTVDVNSKDLLVKYHSLKNAFATEKSITRELQSRLRSMEGIISDIRKNMTTFMTSISDTTSLMPDITTVSIINTNCTTIPESGVYTIYLGLTMSPVTVYCDQETDGGGWIVFMRRQDGSESFYRSWSDYKLGFGSPDGEFWAGNDFLHNLTKARPKQLRIDIEDFDRNTKFAMYEEFQIGTEEDKYRLHVRGYSGTAGDSLIDTRYSSSKHAGMQFSTFDSDNDKAGYNCAEIYKAGWWYNSCYEANLNGQYSQYKRTLRRKGIIWYSSTGWRESLKRVEMKIR